MNCERTTPIVVDMQNDSVCTGGALELPDARNRILHVNGLIQGDRDLSNPILFVRFISDPKQTLIWTWPPMIALPAKCCWRNHRCYHPDIGKEIEVIEIIDECIVKPEGYVVNSVSHKLAPYSSVGNILRSVSITHVLICGVAIDVCINDTVSGAFGCHFQVAVAADATVSFTEKCRRYSLSLFKEKCACVVDTTEIFSGLRTKEE